MFKDTATLILASIGTLFFFCGFAWNAGLAAEGAAFHCSLGLHGQVMAKGEFTLSEDQSALQYKLVVHNIKNVTMAHLHLGKVGKIGTPVVWLYPPSPPPKLIPGLFDGILAQGTVTKADLKGPLRGEPLSSLISEIRAGNVYVNIHTQTHARGDICGPVYLNEE